MPNDSTIFQQVFERWAWKPIRNCPGRYIFAPGAVSLTVNEIASGDFFVFDAESDVVPDTFLVMKFGDDSGGLISYRKSENSFLHTLGDEAGFLKKLKQLKVNLQD